MAKACWRFTETTCRACPKPFVISASTKWAATMSCGEAARSKRASSICRRTGCRASLPMRCARRGRSTGEGLRHWCRPTNHDFVGGKRQVGLKVARSSAGITMEMQDRSVIVTGGASGIGKATAFLLAREGARVFVGDVDEAGGRAAAAEAEAERMAVEYLPLDLIDPSSIAGFAAGVQQRTEHIDGLVNGAGWDQIQPFLENPPEMWDRVMAINLMGAVRLTRGVLPPMVAARAGKIVNISSDAGRVGSMGETVYAAAKGGLIAFTKSLARELARYQINVNCVCPGPTDTPLFQRQPDRMKEALTRAIPFRRIAQPLEIAQAVLFFLSRQSDYVTGQVLSVSGGLTMAD